ncbi:MAG: hypothetical protein MPW15_13600 [Candidatus Manganitrophus sp.]|nr:hypothetical protein [Candidatus Manganitrophus sp.]
MNWKSIELMTCRAASNEVQCERVKTVWLEADVIDEMKFVFRTADVDQAHTLEALRGLESW